MSRPHDGQRPFSFPFGNPFRMIFPKGSYLSPTILKLLNAFEETLAKRLNNLRLKDGNGALSLSWIKLAMQSLCETHMDIKSLINELKFPVSDWDEKWMDVYLDNSVSLLDICNAFSSELSQLNQGQLILQCARHVLDASNDLTSFEKLDRTRISLDDWMNQINLRNQKLENCPTILHGLTGSLYMSKVKNSAKGKVLMHAMYGVMVHTIFICGVLTSAFSGSAKTLIDLQVPDKFIWADAFNSLQIEINGEVRSHLYGGSKKIVKELEAVGLCVKKLVTLTSNGVGPAESETLKCSVLELGECVDGLSQGVDLLSKEVENFFQIVLSGRDALLCNLRVCDSNSSLKRQISGQEQIVR